MLSRSAPYAAPAYLILCLLLGGASAAGAVGNALLQLVGLALILLSLWNLRRSGLPPEARGLVWVVLAFILIALVSLVPLPQGVWQGLPGREHVVRGYSLLGMPPVSLPLSLDRNGTIASLLSIIPPAAMFLLLVQVQERQRRWLAFALLGFAALSIVLGAFQLFGGPDSNLRFYEITNRSAAVGFFANRNHLATLLLCALPFAGYLAARSLSRGRSRGRASRSGGMIISISVALFLVAGIATVGSLAGFGLLLPAALTSLLIYRRAVGPLSGSWLAALAAVAALFVALAFVGPMSQKALSDKAGSASSRQAIAGRTIDAIEDFAPAGSGLGTFQNVYRLYDDPTRTDREYVNHAHNDYLEAALELGLAGLLLIAAFVAWWGRRVYEVWRGDSEGAVLARAGSVIIGIVLLHSLVDYPIRTAAIAALFATGCALLVSPVSVRRPRAEAADASDGGLRHLSAD
jgi:O-antigen ligase